MLKGVRKGDLLVTEREEGYERTWWWWWDKMISMRDEVVMRVG